MIANLEPEDSPVTVGDPKFTAKVYAACHMAADKASETIVTPRGLTVKNVLELERRTREAAALALALKRRVCGEPEPVKSR